MWQNLQSMVSKGSLTWRQASKLALKIVFVEV